MRPNRLRTLPDVSRIGYEASSLVLNGDHVKAVVIPEFPSERGQVIVQLSIVGLLQGGSK